MYIIDQLEKVGFKVDSAIRPNEISFYNSERDIFAQVKMDNSNSDSNEFPFTLEFYHYPEAHKKVRIDFNFCQNEANVMNSIESLFTALRKAKEAEKMPESKPVAIQKNYLEYRFDSVKGVVYALFPNEEGYEMTVFDFIKANNPDAAELLSNVHVTEIVNSFDNLRECKGTLFSSVIFPDTTSKKLAIAQKERAETFLSAIMNAVKHITENPDLVTADFVKELNGDI